jgi:hypothetical protein
MRDASFVGETLHFEDYQSLLADQRRALETLALHGMHRVVFEAHEEVLGLVRWEQGLLEVLRPRVPDGCDHRVDPPYEEGPLRSQATERPTFLANAQDYVTEDRVNIPADGRSVFT